MCNNRDVMSGIDLLEKVVELAENLEDDFKGLIFASVASTLRGCGEVEKAEKLLRKSVEIGENMLKKASEYFTYLASALSEAEDDRAEEFLELGVKIAELISDKNKRFGAISLASEIFVSMGKYDKAVELLDRTDIPDSFDGFEGFEGLEVYSRIHYILSRIAVEGKLDDAIKFAEKFDKKKRSAILEDIVRDFLESGNVEKAKEVVMKISDEVYRSSALSSIATWLVKKGRVEEGLRLANELGDCTYSSQPKAYAAMKKLEEGDLDGAMELAEGIMDKHYYWVVVEIVEELAKRGDFERAIKLADKIPLNYEFAEAKSKIVKELVKRGKIKESLDLVEKAYSSSAENIWRFYVLASIPEALIELGRVEEADRFSDKIIEEIRANVTSFSDFERIPHILKKIGKLEELESIIEFCIEKLSRDLSSEDRVNFSDLVLKAVVDQLRYLEDYDRAIKLNEKIRGSCWRDNYFQFICYDLIEKDIQKAMEVAEKIENPKIRSECFNYLVAKLAEVDIEKAFEVIEKIESSEDLYLALISLIPLCSEKAK